MLFLMLYFSGLWRPWLTSMYNKRKALIMFRFLLGKARKRLDSSVSYYQAKNQSFWATLKSQVKVPEALSLSNFKIGTKRRFRDLDKQLFCSWLDRSDGTFLLYFVGRALLRKISAFKTTTTKIELFQVLCLARYIFQKAIGKPSGYFSQSVWVRLSTVRPGTTLLLPLSK